VDLQKAYDQYNTANVDLTPYNLNITANLQIINTLSVQLRNANAQLTADTQAAADTDVLIISLEKQLAEARKNKEALQVRILFGSSQIQSTQQKIDLSSADNVNLNNQINTINTNKASLQATYQSLETQAQSTRTAITAVQTQQNQYTSQINQLKKQLTQASHNLDS
jgi:chromosome segregation ATPase